MGDVYIGVFENDVSTEPGQVPIAATVLIGADPSAAPVPYTIVDVPAGDWFVQAFLDDDLSSMGTELPESFLGDLVVEPGVGGITAIADVLLEHNVVLTFRIGG